MDTVKQALMSFVELNDYNYKFIISCQKMLHEIKLTFVDKDFYHLAGFQYLTDIDIPKTPNVLYKKIVDDKINDAYLQTSVCYEKVNDSYANVKNRIWGLQFLQEYLENKNLVCKYVKYMNIYSKIEADYLIISTLNHKTAYIFIRKRKNQETYCICSFFIEPETEYKGIKAYWLFKSKINKFTNEEKIFYNRLQQSILNSGEYST